MTATTPPRATPEAMAWLGVCPLLAGADTLAQGLLLGAVSGVVLLGVRRVPVHATARGGAGIAGLLLIAAGITVILHLACEAFAYDLALASGGLFALATLHGLVAGTAAGEADAAQAGPAWRIALAGVGALAMAGALRQLPALAGLPPATMFFLLAGAAAALQALQTSGNRPA
ncbi:MAG: hypothetical protein HRU81_06825 [Gammaproteobacteria bacterium]|nr:MAG: hypothetical protein HRU81_06825 [Gammaproteobacteria bacterium]